MQSISYPPKQASVNFVQLQPGKAFSQQVTYRVLSIVMFITFYLVHTYPWPISWLLVTFMLVLP